MKRVTRLICFGLLLTLLTGTVALAVPTETEAPQAYEYEEAAIDLTFIQEMMQAAIDGDIAAGTAAEARWNEQIAEEALDFAETAFFETEDTADAIAVAIASYLVAAGITELDGLSLQFRIVASSQNLRVAPTREAERLGSFPHGTIVTALNREDGWKYITDGTLTGWSEGLHLAPFDGSSHVVLPVVSSIADVELPPTVTVVAPPPPPVSSGSGETGGTTAGGHDRSDDLFWLALAIQHEAGSDWLCDEHQLWVGNVVLNRVSSPLFLPTTIYGVLHQRGQYPWATRSWPRSFVSERAFANAQRLLNGERFAPADVVFQAQFVQGITVRTFTCSVTGNVHYFDTPR